MKSGKGRGKMGVMIWKIRLIVKQSVARKMMKFQKQGVWLKTKKLW